jgi:thermitase
MRRRRSIGMAAAGGALAALAMAAAPPANLPSAQPAAVQPGAPADQPGGHASTHIIIRLRTGTGTSQLPDGRATIRLLDAAGKPSAAPTAVKAAASVDLLISRWRVSAIKPALRHQPANQALARQIGLDRYLRLEVPAGTDTPAMAGAFARVGAIVEKAQIDGIGSRASVVPNDPKFPTQWGLRNTGQVVGGQTGIPGADINAINAWDFTTGSSSITIAIIDSGVDPHVELAGKLLTGWYVIDQNTNTEDLCDHGTHVAGIAAALGNNGLGMAGVSWGARILPVRVLVNCAGFEADVADGILFAADAGAHIANMSLQFVEGSDIFHDAVIYGQESGMIMIAAAGNNPAFGVTYPGRFPETIAVAATDNRDQRWLFSSAGPQVDLAAPGVNIESLLNTVQYDFDSGTSMASAYVSGVAALMLSINPDLTGEQVRAILRATADDVEAPGFDNQTGHGRLNAFVALQVTLATLPLTGDFNADGFVNGLDLGILLANWSIPPGSPGCSGTIPCAPDLNADGVVNGLDLGILLGNWSM